MDVSEAAGSGTRRQLLVALRDRLAAALDATSSGRDMVSLSRALLDVVRELAALDVAEEQERPGLRLVPDEKWDEGAV